MKSADLYYRTVIPLLLSSTLVACGDGGNNSSGSDSENVASEETLILAESVIGTETPSNTEAPTVTETESVSQPNLIAEIAEQPLYQVRSQGSKGGTVLPKSQDAKQGQTYTFTITPEAGYAVKSVSGCDGTLDGLKYTTGEISADCEVTVAFVSHALLAVEQENHTLATASELIQFSKEQIPPIQKKRRELMETLYQGVGSSISWHPSHDSITFTAFKPENTFEVLRSTQEENGRPSSEGLIYAGMQGDNRYAAMGSSLFSVDTSVETDRLLKNMINWLTDNKDPNHHLNIVTSHVSSWADSWYFPDNEKIREWLSKHYPERHIINAENSCDYEALSRCIDQQKPDLIVFSDNDRGGRGYAAVSDAIEKAKAQHIPILIANTERFASPMAVPLYNYMGLKASGNYWPEHLVKDLAVDDLKAVDSTLMKIDQLLSRLETDQFDISVLDNCDTNFMYCSDPEFQSAFKNAADWYRNAAIGLDNYNIKAFETDDYLLVRAGLLLADKYRSAIDYPIVQAEAAAWQQAMFADWVISYARTHNLAQPDLGEYIVDNSKVTKGSKAHYAYPDTVNESQTITVPYSDQWTTTGWYALPGQAITISRTDSSDATLVIKLNYHRSKTNRVFETKEYRGPIEVAQQRIQLAAGETVSFSTPYGGPIYAYLEGSQTPVQVSLTAQGVAKHPAIMDFSDPAEIIRFNQAIKQTEIPHVDLRTDGAEQHLRRDRFLDAINDSTPTVSALLKSIEEDHINSVYTLAGYKIQGKTLQESLPDDVKTICSKLFGAEDCFNSALHIRSIIQHANYDQHAQCGAGCSGNPWDVSWEISPTGWGDNHELGHNLQTNKLNVQYAEASGADDWSKYGSRAGENSNNIFPYFVKWKAHYLRDGNTTTLTDDHMDHKDLFYVFMSDAAGITDSSGKRVVVDSSCDVMDEGADRFTVPWKSNAYATHNSYRMAFYIQMALRADRLTMVTGDKLDNGFNIFTLLYQHSRIFEQYAENKNDWMNNREKLGFGMFPYEGHAVYGEGDVRSIPGNDFMLVSLSLLTNQDWRPYFDMLGLRYTTLAASQVAQNAKGGAVKTGMYVLEQDLPPATMSLGLNFLEMSLTEPATVWPRDGSSPVGCRL